MAVTSSTDIANQALGHLGVQYQIADIAEGSPEALACTLYYDQARDEVLRDFPWPFATEIGALALVAEDPNDEWYYSYRYPAGAVRFRRILNDTRRLHTADTTVAMRIGSDATGRLIFTDHQDAYGEWTSNITDVTKFPPDYVACLVFKLATYIAPRVTAGDPNNLRDWAAQMYLYHLGRAQANALNEEMPDTPPDSEFIRVRE
jgi:hypothetical protein